MKILSHSSVSMQNTYDTNNYFYESLGSIAFQSPNISQLTPLSYLDTRNTIPD